MTQTGTIERFEAARGFGFIASSDGQRQIFFHVRDVRGSTAPAVGQRVRFERIEVGGKGPRAMAVQVVGGASGAQAAAPRPSPSGAGRRDARPARAGNAGSNRSRGQARSSAGERRTAPSASGGQPLLFGVALLVWMGLLAALTWRGLWPVAPLAVLGGLLALNLATYLAYAMDKSAAQQGRWRTAENTLHALALAGGWPAAWLAQRTLRHKSSKTEFLVVYVLTVLAHGAALGALLWRG